MLKDIGQALSAIDVPLDEPIEQRRACVPGQGISDQIGASLLLNRIVIVRYGDPLFRRTIVPHQFDRLALLLPTISAHNVGSGLMEPQR